MGACFPRFSESPVHGAQEHVWLARDLPRVLPMYRQITECRICGSEREEAFGIRDLFVQCVIVAEKAEKGRTATASRLRERSTIA